MPELDPCALAQTLIHHAGQQLSCRVERGSFVAAQVGLGQPLTAAGPERDDSLVVLTLGEILELASPAPAGSAEIFRAAYVQDPSCDFLARSSGVFCGVVFDPERRRIVLFTDPLGIGQLYYRAREGSLLFASEQKCFARLASASSDLSASAVAQFLREGQLCGATTWFDDVHLLAPGHSATFDLERGQVIQRSYHDVTRPTLGRYGSYQEAKQQISAAYTQAFQRSSCGLESVKIALAGDFSSRMLLASSEAAGLHVRAYTAAQEDAPDLLYAQKASAVHNTIHKVVRTTPSAWLLARARLSWLADGADLSDLPLAPLTDALAGAHVLHGGLGALALGVQALRGFDDLRARTLVERSRRKLGALAQAVANFAQPRFPFADRSLWAHALSAEVSYLRDHRLQAELALGMFPDYFRTIPVKEAAYRTAVQLLARGSEQGPSPATEAAFDAYAFLRADPASERFIWQLLSSHDALYSAHTDQKPAHAAFWSFFHAADPAALAPLLRYVSLELWLRQLLRAEKPAAEPVAIAAKSPARVPDVSVIVPAYNVQAYLGECLNSLCNQELSSIEILVVDDGSSDDTPNILARFAADDPRIRVISSENAGVYHARNLGLAAATGRYISFVDADDYVHPAMLKELVTAADAQRAQVTFCDVYQFDAGGEARVRSNTLGFPPSVPLSLATAPGMISDGFSTLWNRIYDRAFLARHALRFDESYRISADMLFLQELLARADTIVRVPRALYYYRFATPNSLTSYQVRNSKHLVHLKVTIELVDFWVRRELFARYAPFILLRAVRNFLWNTHIDEQRLREIFEPLHVYLRKLAVSPVAVAKLPAFERRAFSLIRSGDYPRFMRHVRRYRAKMVQAKGGELGKLERLQLELDAARRELSRRVSLKLKKDPSKRVYRVLWPAAQVGVTMAYGDGYEAVPGEAAETAGPDTPPARALTILRATRDRLLLGAQLDEVARHAKRSASRSVLHFSNAFSVPSETFTYDVITGLEEVPALDNYVMCFNRQLERERPYPKTVELLGATRDDLELLEPRAMSKIELVLGRLKPHLVHCHFGWVGIPFALWMEQAGRRTPLVITMHGTDVNMWPARHAWYADALKSMTRMPWVSFTTHTETYREKLERLGVLGSQIQVIPNSFDPKFALAGQRHGFEHGDHLRIISVARMDIWKGQDHLIRGFARFVRERYSNASLSLVGYGPEEAALRELVERLGVQENVRFYGRAAHHEVPVLLRNHDVYVQPSIKHPETLQEEGQPIAVLEAIATGMPVIVTDTGGLRETVCVEGYEGSAWVIPDRDDTAIAGALQQVIESAPRAAARRAYVAAIVSKHARARQLSATLEVYERAWR